MFLEICLEDKQEGQCGGIYPRFWYNATSKRCERFIYTGCKGNRNQFETADACKRMCLEGYESPHGEVGKVFINNLEKINVGSK